MDIQSRKRVLALDIGEKRIGVALSDAEGILASPLKIIDVESESEALKDIAALITEYGVQHIIAGLPRSMDGSLGPQSEKTIAFIAKLTPLIKVPLEFRDERLTTVTAQQMLSGKKRGKKGIKPRYDAAAAAILLQNYLDESHVFNDND
jgi:putative holliday junction resolvase